MGEVGATREVLQLMPVLDLRDAGNLRKLLLDGLSSGRPVTLDAGPVARMSTACVQVLAAFLLAARQRGVPAGISKASPAFDAAFGQLGLADTLQDLKSGHAE